MPAVAKAYDKSMADKKAMANYLFKIKMPAVAKAMAGDVGCGGFEPSTPTLSR